LGEQVIRRTAQRAIILVLAVLVVPVSALAQGTPSGPPSRGWWFGAGGGYLSFRADCETCEHGDTYTGGGGILGNAGVSLNDRLDVGAEVFTAFSGDDLNNYRTTYTLAVAQYRLWRSHGFFLKGGFGLAFLRGFFTVDGQSGSASSRGLGVHYGAGWIVGQGRRVSFAPFGAQYIATVGDIALPSGATAKNAVGNAWMAGVVVLFR
jgi:hypothetical protein